MTNIELLQKINSLDNELKAEALDFIDFLIQKRSVKPVKKHPKAGFLGEKIFIIKDGFNDIPDYFKKEINIKSPG